MAEAVDLEHAHRAVPDDGLGLGDLRDELADRDVADVDAFPAVRRLAALLVGSGALGLGAFLEFLGHAGVGRQQEAHALRLGLRQQLEREVELVGFDAAVAGLVALRLAEGVGHRAADQEGVGFLHQAGNHLDLVGDLRATHDDEEGLLGGLQFAVEVFEFALHQEAHRALRHEMRHAFGRGMGAVGGAEGVVDVDLGAAGEGLGEAGLVGFLGGVKAGVFQQQHLAGLQGGAQGGDFLADAIRGEHHHLAEDFAEQRRGRGQRELRIGPALRPAEVGAEDQLRTAGEQMLDRRNRALDAGVIGDDAVLERDIEVHTHEDFLAVDVEVADRELGHGAGLPEDAVQVKHRVGRILSGFRPRP